MPSELIKFKIKNSCVKIEQKNFWSIQSVVESSQANQITSNEEAKHLIKSSLESSVKSQMLSDVPLGGFLSGGVDSSLITAMMQKNSMKKIETFTAKFESSSLDDQKWLKI